MTRAHPRVCGENIGAWGDVGAKEGSSPRVRGKLQPRTTKTDIGRLIPACAGKTCSGAPSRRARWAHPRVCGENRNALVVELVDRGSSPRVRGKPRDDAGVHSVVRLIPACAGKTCALRPSRGRARAHPRVCGENRPRQRRQIVVAGSSPRVRGKPLPLDAGGLRFRLIPACAGKTGARPRAPANAGAHPRVCGENVFDIEDTWEQAGSSPRVRGKPYPPRRPRPREGLIPACAGKTTDYFANGGVEYGSSPRVRGKLPQTLPSHAPDRLIPACAGKTAQTVFPDLERGAHPRVCGENVWATRRATWSIGSSPRVRGKQLHRKRTRWLTRLIPACAGKTGRARRPRLRGPAHPRVCGENGSASLIPETRPGSSPRVRGKPRRRDHQPFHRGLIPACAGKTRPASTRRRASWAHPRVCGENQMMPGLFPEPQGSSPRVRGKRKVGPHQGARVRLIPACAGKTFLA